MVAARAANLAAEAALSKQADTAETARGRNVNVFWTCSAHFRRHHVRFLLVLLRVAVAAVVVLCSACISATYQ